MKRLSILSVILATSLIVPQIVFAAWWNPLSWNMFSWIFNQPHIQENSISIGTSTTSNEIPTKKSVNVATSTTAGTLTLKSGNFTVVSPKQTNSAANITVAIELCKAKYQDPETRQVDSTTDELSLSNQASANITETMQSMQAQGAYLEDSYGAYQAVLTTLTDSYFSKKYEQCLSEIGE